MNMTVLEKVCCMLSNAELSKSFWAKALAYTFHLINSLSLSAIGGKTLLEVWSRKVAQDYHSSDIWLSGLLSCQGRQVGSESEKRCVNGFQKRCEKLQNLQSKG